MVLSRGALFFSRRTVLSSSRRMMVLSSSLEDVPCSLNTPRLRQWFHKNVNPVICSCMLSQRNLPSCGRFLSTTTKASDALVEKLLHADLSLDKGRNPLGMTYFELLCVPMCFNLTEGELNEAMRALQRKLHPDQFATAEESLRDRASMLSAVMNEAYATLRNPAQRAQYILGLHGVNAIGEDASTDVDPSVLMEIMSVREEVDAARADGDVTALRCLRSVNAEKMDALLLEMHKHFESVLDGGLSEEERAKALDERLRALTVRLNYLQKASTEIEEDLPPE